MRRSAMRVSAILASVLVGCVTTSAAPAKQARRGVALSAEEASALVAEFEAKQAAESKGDPLTAPTSLKDVFAILQRDQIDLFKAGVDFAAKQDGAEAAALRAQIELAWGEAQMILADVFADTSGQLRSAVRALEIRVASGEGTDKDVAKLAQLEEIATKSDALAEALSRQAAEHVVAGNKLAKAVIEAKPSDYVGYRVAADYYRLRGDWAQFDAMLQKIEETNPGSNGLVFLRGAAALQRDADVKTAEALFRQALEKDPKFTRAQAQLVLAPGRVRDTYAEYQKLRALNPKHQIVVWAGEAITAAFEAQRKAD